jgi:phosphoglycolate phosphatase
VSRPAVLFDLDGTLLDTPAGIVRAFTAALAELSAPAAEPLTIRATIGLPLPVAFSMLLDVPVEDPLVAAGVGQYQRCFREIVLPGAVQLVFPGVLDGLVRLREAGYPLAVATSKFYASADAVLVAAGLRELFDEVLGADQVANPKPHPEMAFALLDRLGSRSADAVMVGDTSHDLLMARAAGLRSVAVTYGVHSVAQLVAGIAAEPTWLVDSFAEAIQQIERALPARQHAADARGTGRIR